MSDGRPMKVPPLMAVAATVSASTHGPRPRLPRKYSLTKLPRLRKRWAKTPSAATPTRYSANATSTWALSADSSMPPIGRLLRLGAQVIVAHDEGIDDRHRGTRQPGDDDAEEHPVGEAGGGRDLAGRPHAGQPGADGPAVGVVLVAEEVTVADGPYERQHEDDRHEDGLAARVPVEAGGGFAVGHESSGSVAGRGGLYRAGRSGGGRA